SSSRGSGAAYGTSIGFRSPPAANPRSPTMPASTRSSAIPPGPRTAIASCSRTARYGGTSGCRRSPMRPSRGRETGRARPGERSGLPAAARRPNGSALRRGLSLPLHLDRAFREQGRHRAERGQHGRGEGADDTHRHRKLHHGPGALPDDDAPDVALVDDLLDELDQVVAPDLEALPALAHDTPSTTGTMRAGQKFEARLERPY